MTNSGYYTGKWIVWNSVMQDQSNSEELLRVHKDKDDKQEPRDIRKKQFWRSKPSGKMLTKILDKKETIQSKIIHENIVADTRLWNR